MSKVKTFGLDIVFPKPKDSKAVISAFNTADPVCLIIPIPLVAPIAGKFDKASDALPKAAVELLNASLAVLEPARPPARLPFLLYAAPNLVPSALSNSESASTIKASIKTCFVLTSISLITLSTTSKSFSLPLTIIDLVVVSSVT